MNFGDENLRISFNVMLHLTKSNFLSELSALHMQFPDSKRSMR